MSFILVAKLLWLKRKLKRLTLIRNLLQQLIPQRNFQLPRIDESSN